MRRGRVLPGSLACAALLASALAPAAAAGAQPAPRRGPFEAREEWLLTQGRLALSAASPDSPPAGATLVRLDLDWGNDFGRSLGRFFVDGEHRALALAARRGLGASFAVGARLPLLWRGGGFLDRFADLVHELGFPDNGRPSFPRDRLVVRAVARNGRPIDWGEASGSGLGPLELEGRFVPAAGRRTRGAPLALVGRVALPTGTGPFAGGGAQAAVQALAALPVGAGFDLYAGTGVVLGGARRSGGFEYQRARLHGHAALEWRFARRWSALAQLDGAGRLLGNVPGYPALQSYLRLGFKRDVGARTTLEGAFSENLKNQQATTDFGVYLALARRF